MKFNIPKLFFLLSLLLSLIVLVTCKKLEKTMFVSTGEVTNILTTAAEASGQIIDLGEGATQYGHCYAKTPNVTIAGSKTQLGIPAGTVGFTSQLTDLDSGTLYYIKAYLSNGNETVYGKEISFSTYGPVTDIDGNVYNTVKIGTQVWMNENLKTTKYNDNTSIPIVTNTNMWSILSTPGYCWNDNDEATNKATYGGLYNWYTVNTGKLCPIGWHVPGDAEWTLLTNYLEGVSVAGGKLKESGYDHWNSPNTGATNETGFNALPGGSRGYDGIFGGIGDYGFWWSSSGYNSSYAWYRYVEYDLSSVARSYGSKEDGFSVRCVRD
jgi:uncharacterized protein (TIGR02145 family)